MTSTDADVRATLANVASDLDSAAVACRAAAGGASLRPVISALSSSMARLLAVVQEVPAEALDALLDLPAAPDGPPPRVESL